MRSVNDGLKLRRANCASGVEWSGGRSQGKGGGKRWSIHDQGTPKEQQRGQEHRPAQQRLSLYRRNRCYFANAAHHSCVCHSQNRCKIKSKPRGDGLLLGDGSMIVDDLGGSDAQQSDGPVHIPFKIDVIHRPISACTRLYPPIPAYTASNIMLCSSAMTFSHLE